MLIKISKVKKSYKTLLDVLESVFIIWLIILACGDEREERWMENGERQKEKKRR